ncbi:MULTISPECIES: M23 family metallopeptidase [Streptomyces]|uniref:M23 family metallopeptidase n=1 Tax=Streptomyces TaxID=1883 RepID=UPI000F5543D4|nr:M23 family metallopeptidase [Streptomyces sp. ADI97-07]RPK80156.1 Glycyl-glycine endopeptidase LytM precursor [Streptomyces sp. ADI97-07]WRY83770.1 peptidoglycan DD-metalloendopeptidase family protein [Streptomyces clavifer]
MNDQHPHAGYAGYDSRSTGGFDTDPLFGSLSDHQDGSHETAYGSGYTTAYDNTHGGYDTAHATGAPQTTGPYDTAQHGGQWDTGAHQQASYDAYAAQAPQQTYDTTATWMPEAGIPAQAAHPGADATGQWDTTGWDHTGQADQWAAGDTGAFPTSTFSSTAYATGTYTAPVFETSGYGTADTGTYDATAWNTGGTPETAAYAPEQTSYPAYEHQAAPYEPYGTAEFGQDHTDATPGTTAPEAESEAHTDSVAYDPADRYDPADTYDPADAYSPADQHDPADAYSPAEAYTPAGHHDAVTETADVIDVTAPRPAPAAHPVGRSAPRGGSRGRRRTPAKRSALLTVAVPSACVMSVAGIAAASVSGVGGAEEQKDDSTSVAAAETIEPAVANNKLDTQLANLSADAENFADRASRTQERIDLKVRQAADKKKREDEAARREAARPKFALPVNQHGLSAYYGQAGVNWMSAHTGIDFPVGLGTPVMAATDGTVRTQLNSAYGNMVIVTAADGTETWYCHLSAAKIRSGPVKAGDVIAYSGDSGNSTGPHLHFEVRPGGGAAIDPLAWLRSHGLSPT